MRLNALLRAAALAAIVATGASADALAETTAADPHPALRLAQATPPAAPGAMQGPGAQPGQPGMMPPGMMAPGMGGTMQPGTMGAGQATPPTAPGAMPGPSAQAGQPGTMPPGMMGPGMMGGMMQHGMMGGMPMMAMHSHMMKVMFAVADADGDGALSFEEVTTMHKRIFDKVDVNRDGKVTPAEFQAFMRE
jgi:hypothetical protein